MKQETVEGYCKHCRRRTIWIKHADLPYYICTIRGCWSRCKNPKEEKEEKIDQYYSINEKIKCEGDLGINYREDFPSIKSTRSS